MAKLCLIILAITVVSYTCGQHANEATDSFPQALVLCKPGTKNEIRAKPSRKTHKRSLLFVSTLDGKITALDSESGRYVWSIMTGPGSMLSSSISKIEISNRGQWVRLIPSLEGNLFKFDGTQFEALPVSADNLLSNSLKVADDVIITGGKDNRGYGINYTSGKLKYICAMDGCKFFGNDVVNQDDILVVRRYTNIIRAADPKTGLEKWNYSVAQHELEFVDNSPDIICEPEKVENDDATIKEQGITSEPRVSESDIKIVIPQGLIMALSAEPQKPLIWQHQFNSPIANAWLMHDGELKKIDLLENFQTVPTTNEMADTDDDDDEDLKSAALYLGIHQQQYYIQQSKNVHRKVTEAAIRHVYHSDSIYPHIKWKPYVHTAVSRTPLIMGSDLPDNGNLIRRPKKNEGTTALIIRHDNEYPYDGGYYILTEDSSMDFITPLYFINSNKTDTPEITFALIWKGYWRQIMALIISIILINVTILIYYSRKWIRVSNVPATVAPADTENKLESKSENTLAIVSNNKVDFISRYYTDFEPVQCLGKGGFGVVFQARNKIDDCEYAIKRICLPNREDAREKVMREVKALAKLDHVGIVRYFNAWLEAPPPGWQESMDKHWEHSNVVSSDCSAEHAEKMNAASEQSHKVMADIITKLTNNNSFSAVDCTKKEEESGSYSFDHKDNAKCLDTVFQNSLHLPLEGGDSRDLPGEELWTLPFQQYKNLNSLDFNEIPMKDIDSHGDSFIVFEDSGCGDRSISVEKSAPFGDKQEDGQEGKGLELVLFKKENGSGSKFRPKLCSSSGFKYSPVNSRCTKIYLHIQMQLCQKDNLKDWLNVNSDTRNKFQVLDFFDQIVSAVEYVHDQGLMHRDLKPSNIFFSMDGTIKVGDFGLVTAMAEETIDHTPFDENSPKKHTDQVGTQLYMSPEQIMGLTYNHKVDIFSLGLVLFELLTPFKTQMERLQVMVNVKQHIFPGQFEKEHSEESQFVKLMLSHNPEARPSAVDIKNHSILQAFQPRPEVLRHRRTRNASRTYSTSSSGSLDWSNS